jgi:hypothetical protein
MHNRPEGPSIPLLPSCPLHQGSWNESTRVPWLEGAILSPISMPDPCPGCYVRPRTRNRANYAQKRRLYPVRPWLRYGTGGILICATDARYRIEGRVRHVRPPAPSPPRCRSGRSAGPPSPPAGRHQAGHCPSHCRHVDRDLVRTKPALIAENALLRQQLIIVRRSAKRPRCTTICAMVAPRALATCWTALTTGSS